MDTTGTVRMGQELLKHRWMTCLCKHLPNEALADPFLKSGVYGFNFHQNNLAHCIWYSMGITDDDFTKLDEFVGFTLGTRPNLCVDVANGYTDVFVDRVAQIREKCPDSIIMAGNVATPEMVDRLIRQGGADIVKVGIGPGSVCTTRLVTGVGYPQLSAVLECADAAHGNPHGYICADGGCTTSGDVCKAFGANADFVMLGGMLAGTEECEGEWEYRVASVLEQPLYPPQIDYSDEKLSLKYYGMSSYQAQDKHNNKKDYRASEGKAVKIPYKGPVEGIVQQVEGGLRSCCAYIGASDIKHMGRCTTFIKVNRTHNQVYETSNQFSSEETRHSAGVS
jgi:GMP reductase